MFKLIKREIRKIDSKAAVEFLKMNTLGDIQRPIRDKHVATLKEAIESGLFLTAEIGIASLNYDGNQRKLVNGQHTCTAVSQTSKHISALVEYFDVYEPEDLALLYRQFDAHASRSLSDILRPEASALGISWSPKVVNLTVQAACLKEGKATVPKSQKVELLKKYLQFGKFLNSLLHDKEATSENSKIINRGAVSHAMLLSYEKAQEDSKKFWISVRDGENLKRDDPAYKLRNYLMQTGVNYGRGAACGLRSATYHEITSKSISAWNAFRRNERTDLKYFRDKSIPRAI